MPTPSLLPILTDDLPFVREMLYEAAYWRAEPDPPPVDQALKQPELALYIASWGRPGDEGLVARICGSPVGAVWVRRFREDEHGYGYVDERTPEVSIAVAKDHRGCGIGRCLLSAMLAQQRVQGITRVSLSVETANPARALYEGLGFVPWRTVDGAVTMVWADRDRHRQLRRSPRTG